MPDLSAQMDAVCHRFEELSVRLNQPDAAADPALFRKLMRDYHETQPVVQAYRDWQTARDHLAQAKALLEEPISDPDFKQMIQQEISEKSQDVAKLENNLKILLLPRDPRDEKNVIMEIRGGAGGEEAALFAHSLLRMYTMYVQSRGWTLELLNLNETELGGVKEAIFSVEGAGAYNRLKYESGVHRVQRVPETETQGRIHTSTATVAVMPQAEEVDVALDPKDLRIDTFRSSGAGGVPERAQPVPEQGQGTGDPAQPSAGPKAEGTAGRHQLRAAGAGGHRGPQREDPHLQFPAGPLHRPPHRPDGAQPCKDPGRQPR